MKKIIVLLIAIHTILLANTPNERDILASSPMDTQKPTNGKGVFPSTYEKAFEWFKSAELGNDAAQYEISQMYRHGEYVKENRKKSFEWLLKSAKQGNDDATYSLGLMYKNGEGIQQDYEQAFKWFMESAAEGNKYAQMEIGDMYYFGQGATKNYKKAFEWSMKSAQQGNARAQHAIGGMYFYGRGVKKDYKKAFEWFMKSARNDYVDVQPIIGYMYDNDYGVKKDYKKAFEWFMKSARNGLSVGQYNVGIMYANGRGVKKNYISAHAWYNLASSNGYDASEAIGKIEPKMTKDQIAIAQEYNPLEGQKRSKVQDSTGTGFFVSKSKVLTNHHVISSCKDIELIRKEYTSIAKVIAKDANNDLAILEADTANSNSLKFGTGKGVRIGNEIVVLGYPLGDVLGTGIKLTTGSISSLTGLADDTSRLQMSAPVQPGNSGGPMLDTSGNIVGVVYARVEKSISGRLTQTANLAIKANVAQKFLDSYNVDYAVEPSHDVKDLADIEDEARESIAKVICHH
ncbi:MAG: tetratricopeptide repeat-containing serine protease family protein [Campylobacterota bacterium]|nr:tetratricopeptide repeat-containing serine protease family protein [Campylobacterota bacterium]